MHEHVLNIVFLVAVAETCSHMGIVANISILVAAAGALQTIHVE